MPRAVRFDHYGDIDVLHIVDVDQPSAEPGRVVVEVVSTAINPGEIAIRAGQLHAQWPATFPSGQGSDFAGRVAAVGADVTGFAVGDDVLGFTDERAAQADYVAVPATQLVPKPAALGWDEAATLHVAGCTAYAAVRAVAPQPGETVVVSGAAGGVGVFAIQLAKRAGARVIGIAGAANQDWLRSLGVEPVTYGDDLATALRSAAPDGIDAFVDTFGGGYVKLAIELGVPADRIDTIIDFAAVAEFGVKGDGSAAASTAPVLSELAELAASGDLIVPIAGTYPLEQVGAAYTELGLRHTRGKIVLRLR